MPCAVSHKFSIVSLSLSLSLFYAPVLFLFRKDITLVHSVYSYFILYVVDLLLKCIEMHWNDPFVSIKKISNNSITNRLHQLLHILRSEVVYVEPSQHFFSKRVCRCLSIYLIQYFFVSTDCFGHYFWLKIELCIDFHESFCMHHWCLCIICLYPFQEAPNRCICRLATVK